MPTLSTIIGNFVLNAKNSIPDTDFWQVIINTFVKLISLCFYFRFTRYWPLQTFPLSGSFAITGGNWGLNSYLLLGRLSYNNNNELGVLKFEQVSSGSKGIRTWGVPCLISRVWGWGQSRVLCLCPQRGGGRAGVGGGLYNEVQCIMGEGHIQTPCEKTKRHEWKHYLSATLLAGGNNWQTSLQGWMRIFLGYHWLILSLWNTHLLGWRNEGREVRRQASATWLC